MRILRAGFLYFVLAFGVGFALGTIRVLWVVPRFGTRMAELIEMPVMLVASVLAARWVAQHLSLPPKNTTRLGVGLTALAFLLVTELTAVLWLRGLTIGEYFAERDPIAATAYFVALGVFAIMPLLVCRR